MSIRDAVADEVAAVAPALRPSRLAGDRRHPPLDRGDGRRHSRSAARPPHEVHRDMSRPAATLWLAERPLLLASGSTTRRDMLWAAGIPVETDKPDIDEREVEQPLAQRGRERGRHRRRARLRQGARRLARPSRPLRAREPTRRWPARAPRITSRPISPPPVASSQRSRAARISCIRPSSWSAMARSSPRVCRARSLTMRPLSEAFIAAYVATAGAAHPLQRRRLPARGSGHPALRGVEGDHFTVLGLPLLAVLEALREQGLLLS